MKTIFKNIYDVAVIERIVPYNFVDSLPITSKKEKKKVLPLTIDEQMVFLEYAKNSFYEYLYILALNTGLRAGELIGLSVNDIDLESRVIHVRRQLVYKNQKGVYRKTGTKYMFIPPKRNSIRDVPLNDEAANAIQNQLIQLNLIKRNKLQTNNQAYRKIPEFDDLLFLSRTGTPLSKSVINTELYRIVKRINKDDNGIEMGQFSMHVLRHTFSTRCYDSAHIDMYQIQKIMGHKNSQTTSNVYVEVPTDYRSLNKLYNKENFVQSDNFS
jgi:integrase